MGKKQLGYLLVHSPGTPKRPKAAINVGDRGSLDFSVLLLLAELLEDRLNRRSAFLENFVTSLP